MTDQPTPKQEPLVALAKELKDENGKWSDFDLAKIVDRMPEALGTPDTAPLVRMARAFIASRAERDSLRAAVAEAENDRISVLKALGFAEHERDALAAELDSLKRTVAFQEEQYLKSHGGSWGKCKYQDEAESLAAELAAARKVIERREQATENLIRHAIEVADFIEDEYATGNDDGDIIPVSSPAHKLHSCLWGAIFKADLPDGAVTLAARDSAENASGGGGE